MIEHYMSQTQHIRHEIPRSAQRFHFSRAAIGFLAVTILLGLLLVYSTMQNINRAEKLMEQFLLDKGETIIQSIEAESRATLMHHMGSGNPLHTLLAEYTKDRDIHHIIILDADGSVIENVGKNTESPLSYKEISTVKDTKTYHTKLDPIEGTFVLSRVFRINNSETEMHKKVASHSALMSTLEGDKIISIGLRTEQFDLARQQDVRHTMFMGAILFLVSSAGLYFLFLYQKVRITGSNLSDMKLYTDNIIESIPVSLITLDARDQIVSCNGNAEEILGKSFSNIHGTSVHQALPNCSDVLTEACGSSFEHEVDFKDKEGKIIPLKLSCSPLVNNSGEQIGKVLILRDLSMLKDMELQLERSRRMAALGKMAAGIAHEIRNPLGTLRGFVQFLCSDPEITEQKDKYSKLMISEIDRLNKTVSGLLQFSRPRDLLLQHFDITELLNKAKSLMQADITSKDIKFSHKIESDMIITADQDLLLQVLINLLKNSINASPQGGSITLSASTEEPFHKISIFDSGSGMSKEEREKMFDPFFTTNRSGTGLGLTVSHQIVEQHSGTFEVSTQKGQGTNIAICLPIQEKVYNGK